MAKAKAEALLLSVLVLTSCFAASSSNCIPRRLLMLPSTRYPQPCNDDNIGRPKPNGGNGDDDGPKAGAEGSRIGRAPPAPNSRATYMGDPAGGPGSHN
ncbi:hypothetical protein EJB05_21839 [Eragrostis curvula]|uniref:Uncharacterized protein n=1 Tax=Eragrostis curvula TaxID=38414 RepID=A0A5J9V281_9POAL|nr:hypothetical protein EJB05_21839 [Eragrostis curvula]